jgi:hypothetical protein
MEQIGAELRRESLRGIRRADVDTMLAVLARMKENLQALDKLDSGRKQGTNEAPRASAKSREERTMNRKRPDARRRCLVLLGLIAFAFVGQGQKRHGRPAPGAARKASRRRSR